MALPTRGQPDWDDEMAGHIAGLEASVASSSAVSETARTNATTAIAIAQDAAAKVDAFRSIPDAAVADLVEDAASATAVALSATIAASTAQSLQRFSPLAVVGTGNVAVDTAAFQAAAAATDGPVYLPRPSSGAYEIDTTVVVDGTHNRAFIASSGATSVRINYRGAGFCFQSASPTPADAATHYTDLVFANLNVVAAPGFEAVPDGAFHISGCYKVVFDNTDARGFTKAGAVGFKIADSFNVTLKHFYAAGMTSGVGVQIAGSLMQVTNVQLWDFLIQDNATDLEVSTGILGGGLSIEDGAFKMPAAGVGVHLTGQFANVRFKGIHAECYEPVGTNTSTFVKADGAGLYVTEIDFDGIDVSNVKTIFDLDGSAGFLRDVSFDHIYATGLTGLAGTAYKLNSIKGDVRRGQQQINSAFYTTVYDLTSTHLGNTRPPLLVRRTSNGLRNNTAAISNDGQLTVYATAGTYAVDTYLVYDSSTVADLKVGFSGATASFVADGMPASSGSTPSSVPRSEATGTYPLGGAGVGTKLVAMLRGTLTVAADGTVTFQWAQNTAEATDTTLYAGSWMRLTPLP